MSVLTAAGPKPEVLFGTDTEIVFLALYRIEAWHPALIFDAIAQASRNGSSGTAPKNGSTLLKRCPFRKTTVFGAPSLLTIIGET
jgi:hypothetical protein